MRVEPERPENLADAGYHNYEEIKAEVNRQVRAEQNQITTETKADTPKKSVFEVAKDVRTGKYGNMPERKQNLKEAGYPNYEEIRQEVNRQERLRKKGLPIFADGQLVRIKRTATNYVTRQPIPTWVKNRAHKATLVDDTKVLLGNHKGGINSLVYLKDIQV